MRIRRDDGDVQPDRRGEVTMDMFFSPVDIKVFFDVVGSSVFWSTSCGFVCRDTAHLFQSLLNTCASVVVAIVRGTTPRSSSSITHHSTYFSSHGSRKYNYMRLYFDSKVKWGMKGDPLHLLLNICAPIDFYKQRRLSNIEGSKQGIWK